MMLLDSGEIESESKEDEQKPPTVDVEEDDDNVQTFATREVLVVKRSLNTQSIQDEQQRENIFHTRCLINDKVLVSFATGKYKDKVLCDVISMDASHLLLGRPWQFDKRAIHDGFTNRYYFCSCSLSVYGEVITGLVISIDWSATCEQLLGKVSNKFTGSRIEMRWLEDNFKTIDASTSDVEKEQFVHVFIVRWNNPTKYSDIQLSSKELATSLDYMDWFRHNDKSYLLPASRMSREAKTRAHQS
ncbi:hypothetical protein J1N35_044082 [Gossypium stocksii]|uniref:Uncharacterized protein n=1 Tax=Gossypium stocksii TaxID=47602 RepID=A0A9D3U8U3_9ROSI|nr:hypothetical protein J1N35_044082 [Gossypium stocksii]